MNFLKIQQMVMKDISKAKDMGVMQTKWNLGKYKGDHVITDSMIMFFVPEDFLWLNPNVTIIRKSEEEINNVIPDLDEIEDFEFINRIEIVANKNLCVLAPLAANEKFHLNIMIDKKYFDLFDDPEFFGTTPELPVVVKEGGVLRAVVMPYLK